MLILVVDDEPLGCEALRAKIAAVSAGAHHVIEALSGRAALALMESEKPDLVIADIQMPGLSGIELAEEARRRGYESEFALVSGYAKFEYARTALQMGVHRYLLKPVVEEELREALSAVSERLNQKETLDTLSKSAQWWTRYHADLTREKQLNHCLANRIPFAYDDVPYPAAYVPMLLFLGPDGAPLRDPVRRLAAEFLPAEISLYEDYTDADTLHGIAHHRDAARLEQIAQSGAAALIARIREKFGVDATIALGTGAPQITRRQSIELKALLDLRFYEGHGNIYRARDYTREQLICDEARLGDVASLFERCCIERKTDRAEEIITRLFAGDQQKTLGYGFLCAAFFALLGALKGAAESYAGGNGALIAEEMSTLQDLRGFHSIEEIALYLRMRLHQLLGEEGGELYGRKLILAVKQAIDSEYGESLQVKELARRFNINQSYLSTLFKQEIGLSLSAYLQNLRLEKACSLLQETGIPIADIALAVGYNDPQYFYRLFRKAVGCTAMEWRRRQARDG